MLPTHPLHRKLTRLNDQPREFSELALLVNGAITIFSLLPATLPTARQASTGVLKYFNSSPASRCRSEAPSSPRMI
jgi:hypothetical protein